MVKHPYLPWELSDQTYSKTLWKIVRLAERTHTKAEKILSIESELGEKLRSIKSFGHRTLMDFYFRIMKIFEEQYRMRPNLFEYNEFLANPDYWTLKRWEDFVDQELNTVFQQSPQLAKNVAEAVCFPNPDTKGIAAEKRIESILDKHSKLTLSYFWNQFD